MSLMKLFKRIDRCICKYLSLEDDKLLPSHVISKNDRITVTCTTPHKRHPVKLNWDEYCNISHYKDRVAREKVGMATGKLLAKDLIVSFQKPHVEEL